MPQPRLHGIASHNIYCRVSVRAEEARRALQDATGLSGSRIVEEALLVLKAAHDAGRVTLPTTTEAE
jgi:hypothetical protein